MGGFQISWGYAVTFLFTAGLGYVIARFFNFEGPQMYMITGLLGALGITVWTIYNHFFAKASEKLQARKDAALANAAGGGAAAPAEAGGGVADSSIDQLIKEANQRVTQSNVAQGGTLANLPVIFVVGDRGSTKTSAVVYSGMEPELLAGAVYTDGNMIAPSNVNIWYAKGLVLTEAGGPVFANPASWKALMKSLKPGSWKSLVGKGQQAPRGVLLCFDIESFGAQNAADAIAASSRFIQARLAEMSETLGISFPVYVLFTRTDRVPFFTEFVRNLSNEEAAQVFGVTLPIRDLSRGVYAEEETRRLTSAFNDLFYSLADKRLVLLPRDGDPAKTPQPYEFPREFRKLRQSLVQFLVDVCRPSQLRTSPFLRGFYFAGVRPIVVSDAPILMRQDKQEEMMREAGAATQMFRMGKLQEEIQKSSFAKQTQSGRRVPQWLFLGHFFNSILLNDHAAMGASGSSTKVSGLQRVLLGLGTLLLLGLSAAFITSYFGNRSLENRAIDAAKAAPAANKLEYCSLPSLDQLKQLETLRQSLEELTRYEKDGAPLRLKFGLYAGSDMLPHVRQAYYTRFHALLMNNTNAGMVAFMRTANGRQPGTDDFGAAYEVVRSHLLTRREAPRVKEGDNIGRLANFLHRRWSLGTNAPGLPIDSLACPAAPDSERSALAKKQFDFYAADLVNGNPFAFYKDNDATVPPAQKYLRDFAGAQAAFVGMLSRADAKGKALTYNEFLGDDKNVVSPVKVRYAFTKDGHAFCMKDIEAGLAGEPWVLGEGGMPLSKEELKRGMKELYIAEYVKTWREVIGKARFIPYGTNEKAKERLDTITGNRAPVLGLWWWVTKNTKGIPDVNDKFAPVHLLSPETGQELFVQPPTTNYNQVLSAVKGVIESTSQPGVPSTQQAQDLRSARQRAEEAAKAAVAALPVDKEANLDKLARNLMLAPTEIVIPKVGGELDAAGAAFCTEYRTITSKFPFARVDRPDLSVAELAAIFKPQTGRLWQFYEKELQQYIECPAVGAGACRVKPTSTVPINPAFVDFISNAMRLSRSLYPEGSETPRYTYSITPRSEFYDRFVFNVSGERDTVKSGSPSKKYTWNGAPSYQFGVGIIRKGDSNSSVIASPDGPWAVYRFLYGQADSSTGNLFTFYVKSGSPPKRMTDDSGKELSYQFTLESSAPISDFRDMLARCPAKVAQ